MATLVVVFILMRAVQPLLLRCAIWLAHTLLPILTNLKHLFTRSYGPEDGGTLMSMSGLRGERHRFNRFYRLYIMPFSQTG